MDSKLTLKLNEAIIQRAKEYAQARNISLSRLIENMLSKITSSDTKHEDISPLVKSISGVLPENIQDDYSDYLSQKYK